MAKDFFKVRNGINLGALTSDPSSANAGDMYYNSATNKFRNYNGTTWSDVGSGSGGGGAVNFVSSLNSNDANFESNTVGDWARYQDAAQSTPVDGTGGTPSANLTISTSATNPLDGLYSFILSKTGSANMQGYGTSLSSIAIPLAYRGQVLQMGFYMTVSSGSYTSGDVAIWAYDQDNSALIVPSLISLPSTATGVSQYFISNIQTRTNTTNIRFIIHQSTTTTNNYDLKFDDFFVSPQASVIGNAVGDWTQFTMNITSTGTQPAKASSGTVVDKAFYKIIGDTMMIWYHYEHNPNAGTAGTGQYKFSMPPGYSYDTTKIPTTTTVYTNLGNAFVFDGSAYHQDAMVFPFDSSGNFLSIQYGTGTDVGGSSASLGNGNVSYSFIAYVPIVGLTSGVALSNSRVEYGSNSGMGNVDDSTSFVSDSNGSPIPATAYTSFHLKRVRFKNPIQPGDSIQIQIKGNPAYDVWVDLIGFVLDAGSTNATEAYIQAANAGITFYQVVNSTDIDIGFGRYQDAGNTDWSTSNTSRWRVVKYSNALPVQSYPSNYLAAISSTKTPTNNTYLNMSGNSVTLTPGDWDLNGYVLFNNAGASSYTETDMVWAGANGADNGSQPTSIASVVASFLAPGSGSNSDFNFFALNGTTIGGTGAFWSRIMYPIRVRVTTATTIFLVPFVGAGTAANCRVNTYVYARQVG